MRFCRGSGDRIPNAVTAGGGLQRCGLRVCLRHTGFLSPPCYILSVEDISIILKIPLSGKQLTTVTLRPQIFRKAGAQIVGKELIGGERQLLEVKKGLEEWIAESPDVSLELNLNPIIEEIERNFGKPAKR